PVDEERQREVKELIAKFASDDYGVREAASARLREIGRPAASQVRAELNSASPEVRVRCRRLWQRYKDAASAAALPSSELGTDCLAISPDGQFVVGGDFSGAIRIWDLAARKLVGNFERR